MRRVLTVVAWGLAGIVVTGALTAGAWALAGKEISQPAPPTFPAVAAPSSPRPTETPHTERETHEGGKHDQDESPSATPDHHEDGSGSTSESHDTSGSSGSSGSSGTSDGSHSSGSHDDQEDD